ncbi:ABC transporter ATP-binding protein [Delftia tsuruhatensis]|jgi:ABC-type lipoprotein export system ATPase subunit|uniref:ABC transporter ATP-binding protein n=1 Tax=Delftia tsuruhatensis TaxID=180282 RepID=UPI0030CD3C68
MNEAVQASATSAIRLVGVSKSYRKGGETVHALSDVSLEIGERGMVAIVGPSGSGKSTLLHMMGGMDEPTEGDVIVAGQTVNRLSQQELTRFRRQTVGFVFQTFNLIPNLTALENVALPMEFNGVPKAARLAWGTSLLERFNLGQRLKHRPHELSGGEMQRVAIARAVANEPRLVLADEPTGNLDSRSGRIVYELLREIARERTVIVVTHSEELARLADRVIHIRDGQLLDSERAEPRVLLATAGR